MAKDLSTVLIIDVESTCWDKNPPHEQKSEIIEVGICIYDVINKQRISKEGVYVKPVESEVSDFCTKLTGITPELLQEKGIPFAAACKLLREKYNSNKVTFASWGDYDRVQFERVCKRQGISFPFPRTHINIKTLFALYHCMKKEVGMAKALNICGFPLEGNHHCGMDDAWNIGKLLEYLLSFGPSPII